MANAIERPRGTRDFRPDEMAKRRWLLDVFRRTAESFGYREVQTPTFEHVELFTTKSGDGVLRQIYDFEDKGGRRLTLRPELTAPVIRFFVNELSHEPRPLKLYYHGPCFRYEEPQKGRYREFWQFGTELLGAAGPEADAESIALADGCLRATGLPGYVLHVGHIGALRALVAAASADPGVRSEIFRRIDKDDETLAGHLAERGVDARLAAAISTISGHERRLVLGDEEGAPRAVEEYFEEARAAVRGLGPALVATVEASVARLEEMLGYLGTFGVREVRMDLGVARGLDYYTGVVFEFEVPDLGAEKQVGGGGAYTLAELFGGESTPTVGFGLGFDRILLALEMERKIPKTASYRTDAYVIPIGEAARPRAFELAASLRASGLHVEVDLMRRSPSKNLDRANALGARRAILLGAKELEAGVATVKDMKSGEQRAVPLAELAAVVGDAPI